MCCPCDPDYDRLERENFERELHRRETVIADLQRQVEHLKGVVAGKPGNALTEAYAQALVRAEKDGSPDE